MNRKSAADAPFAATLILGGLVFTGIYTTAGAAPSPNPKPKVVRGPAGADGKCLVN